MGDVKRATDLYRKCQKNPSSVRDRLIKVLADPDSLLRHVAGILLAHHFPSDLPEPTIREMLDTIDGHTTDPADLPPIISEYARHSDEGTRSESEIAEMAGRVEAAMLEYFLR